MTSGQPDTASLIVLEVTETGERYRITLDGRYLIGGPDGPEREAAPLSRIDRGTRRLTPRALDRIRQMITAVGFDTLPAAIPGIATLPPGARPPGSGQFRPRTFVFTVPSLARSVAVEADARLEPSFGALGPLWKALDEEVLGGWRQE